jgi:hypothetical protein
VVSGSAPGGFRATPGRLLVPGDSGYFRVDFGYFWVDSGWFPGDSGWIPGRLRVNSVSAPGDFRVGSG